MSRFFVLMPLVFVTTLATTFALTFAQAAAADERAPIRLAYIEGDIAGMSSILSEDGKTVIGYIEYRQHRRGKLLDISRIAHFEDGSSDEDSIQAEVDQTLRAVRGQTLIRNTKGTVTLDVTIDIARGRITGFSGLGKERVKYDEKADLTPATYWGPLLGIVLRNFDGNAENKHLVFQTVVVTPKPRVFDMEFIRKAPTTLRRSGSRIDVVSYSLSPTFNFVIDPIVRMIAPATTFFVSPGAPPALAGFQGPRNYAGQKIRIE